MKKENNCRADETDEEGQESWESNFVLTSFIPQQLSWKSERLKEFPFLLSQI